MKKERKPESFLQKPSYPGGPKAMRKFLSQHIRYPASAKAEKIEGTVRVRMDIDYQGKVVGTKVLAGLGYGCDEEAQRVVKLLTFQLPKLRKIRATFHKTINIHFHYPKEAPAPATELNYTITSSKTEVVEEDKDSGNSYNYTISL
ncbi:energy transducer TonB [Lewinella sp. LCG006]|uniref:energy transducer TonB n=1 Tax=Lewinella sp. LCG006 TaxID=3231911 RepID=UPI00345FCABD